MSTDPVDRGTCHIYISAFIYVSTLCIFLSVLPVYVRCMYVFLLSLLLLDGILLYWILVCFCCAAPDKLTSPPPFTGLRALHFGIRAVGSKPAAWGHALGL